jgi:hypothetical protein
MPYIVTKMMTLKLSLPVILVIASISIAATLLMMPDNSSRLPNSIAEFAYLSAAYLNARNLGEYHVIAATRGQERSQCQPTRHAQKIQIPSENSPMERYRCCLPQRLLRGTVGKFLGGCGPQQQILPCECKAGFRQYVFRNA